MAVTQETKMKRADDVGQRDGKMERYGPGLTRTIPLSFSATIFPLISR
jgi:hypothetical protein